MRARGMIALSLAGALLVAAAACGSDNVEPRGDPGTRDGGLDANLVPESAPPSDSSVEAATCITLPPRDSPIVQDVIFAGQRPAARQHERHGRPARSRAALDT